MRAYLCSSAACAHDHRFRNDVWSFPIAHSSCEALIVMRMAGEHGVRPYPGSLACFINLCIHQWTATMLAECRARICLNLRDIRRVMDGDDHCPGEPVGSHTLETRNQEVRLRVSQIRRFAPSRFVSKSRPGL